jgi:hypothetical protein
MKKDGTKKDRDKSRDKETSGEPQKVPVIHDLSSRIPGMSDAELNSFLANARRLQASGNATQKKSAEALLPLIETEAAKRATEKEEARKARLTKRKKGSGDDVPPDASTPAG